MAELPAPLVPYEVDLRDFYFMPLDVCRLRDSRIAYAASGEGFRSAVLLWCACWHQIPAASLPDDDVELAHLAGFGRVVSEWLRFKEEAMHGFIKCSDGRIYHPYIATQAINSWREKQMHRWSKECDRLRKENRNRKEKGLELLSLPEKPFFPTEKKHIPPESINEDSGFLAENALKGQGEGQGQGESIMLCCNAREEKPELVSVVSSRIPDTPESPMQFVEYFHNTLGFSFHEAQTVKTIPMFKSWVDSGVTLGMIELASQAVAASLTSKGQSRPSSPMYYKNFVTEIIAQTQQAQKSLGDRTSQNQGLIEKNRGNYDTKTRVNASSGVGKKSLCERADDAVRRVEERVAREQAESTTAIETI
ncbi:DUF1376 domain-containing protein [Methylocucumis oryzae]|uniref:DUF1376 domain-containing protein n=1 Tax=Methylocucumis oryzae TaxID=1632867 RepID=UPI000696A847|nr:DUF1376 domain-containing protein [Methylocucumis oryzae]